ncbi:uncharacterized protein I206_105038 [Kwoniella pini CBS 10737]|uniref:Serine/threonine protein kinase n=1 Tax=Kwoniella pini CBS 10737 TaxID=1296096 RepID=A0A1B9I8F0_9TREE|nr:serine/threonine protein kinase [Kwoniella pini CBS 10737]OCF51862.1 serine/threonine protein kinase [Kwoniella pini CBS 10737]
MSRIRACESKINETELEHPIEANKQGYENSDDCHVDLRDSWSYTEHGGYLDHNHIYYEVRRVPGTLSDRLMNEQEWELLPLVTSAGCLIKGDQIENMTLEQVEARKSELDKIYDDVFQDEDGRWWDDKDFAIAQSVKSSEIFLSLPLVQVDPALHYCKTAKTTDEVKNLLAVQDLPHIVQLVGRSDEGKLVTLRFGDDLGSWVGGPFVNGRRINLPESWKSQWTIDIVKGLKSLHKIGILHKDLTVNNILFKEDHAIICDLECGPHTYLTIPPELAQEINTEWDEKMDIYALGTLIWSIENRNMPRAHRNLKSEGQFAQIMAKCLANDPKDRPSIDEILSELENMTVREVMLEDSKVLTHSDIPTECPSEGISDQDDEELWRCWNDTKQGGYLTYNGIFYEVRRIPDTLSDMLINGSEFTILPQTTSSGLLIIGDRITTLNDEEVMSRRMELEDDESDMDLVERDDGTWATEQDIEATRVAVESSIFQSLPLIHCDDDIHYAKVPRSLKEIENLFAVKGLSNLVQVVGRTADGKVVMERFGQNLTQWIIDGVTDGKINASEKDKVQWILDIATGLVNLHDRGIVHKDLDLNNILFQGNHAIICDMESGETSVEIRPPEFVQGIETVFNKKMDVYGFGTILWSIENRNQVRPHRILRPTGLFKDIMSKCLATNPQDRPTIHEVLTALKKFRDE